MHIIGGGDEIHIVLTAKESRQIIVDHGENEVVIPLLGMDGDMDTVDVIDAISKAREHGILSL